MTRMLMWGVALALLSLSSFCMAQAGDAYRLLGNSIRVDRSSHWDNWIYQNDLVTNLNVPVSEADIFEVETGGLRPVFFRRNINVAPAASDFTYPDLVRASGALTTGVQPPSPTTRRPTISWTAISVLSGSRILPPITGLA